MVPILRSAAVALALALCVAPAPGSVQTQQPPQNIHVSVSALIQQRRFAEAQTQLEEHLRRAPNDHVAWNLLGIAHFSRKRYEQAAVAFAKCDEVGPDDGSVLTNLGAARFSSEQSEAARATFERALRLDPNNSRAHLFLARLAERSGDLAAAEASFRAAVASPTPDPAALFHFGNFLFVERRFPEAKAQLERSLALDANFGATHHTLGLVLQRLGDSEGARRHLARFKDLTEIQVGAERRQMRLTALLQAAYRELAEGHLEAALDAALEARESGPEFELVHRTVADIYRRMGRTAEADAAARRAAELGATSPGAAK